MEQRRLRLGDTLDDYCPRERRVTNHAIVAMIEEDVKQTRCTTCDTEHAYKGGKAPRRRKKEEPALAGTTDLPAAAGAMSASDPGELVDEQAIDANLPDAAIAVEEPVEAGPAAAAEATSDEGEPEAVSPMEDGPVHRPLIRAQLPRPEGQKIERQIPDFTVRHAAAARRGGFGGSGRPKMRTHGGGAGTANGNGNGNRPPGRFSGPRPGASGRSGAPAGFRSGQPRHGGKKRPR